MVEIKLEEDHDHDHDPSEMSTTATATHNNTDAERPVRIKSETPPLDLIINVPSLPALFIPSDAGTRPGFTRAFISHCLGGSPQDTLPRIHLHRKQVVDTRTYYGALRPEWNPYCPRVPGAHGAACLVRMSKMVGSKALEVFVRQEPPSQSQRRRGNANGNGNDGRTTTTEDEQGRIRTPGPPLWIYMGTYNCSVTVKTSPEQWALLPESTRTTWIRGILSSEWGYDFVRRAGYDWRALAIPHRRQAA
ncbi:hypothetical protein HDU85_007234 [Gaertneriomyces sp. JEL0708]|nr:hypothetical protein HDU85_007234 [Gaertneriomyces sp. JEL0708]